MHGSMPSHHAHCWTTSQLCWYDEEYAANALARPSGLMWQLETTQDRACMLSNAGCKSRPQAAHFQQAGLLGEGHHLHRGLAPGDGLGLLASALAGPSFILLCCRACLRCIPCSCAFVGRLTRLSTCHQVLKAATTLLDRDMQLPTMLQRTGTGGWGGLASRAEACPALPSPAGQAGIGGMPQRQRELRRDRLNTVQCLHHGGIMTGRPGRAHAAGSRQQVASQRCGMLTIGLQDGGVLLGQLEQLHVGRVHQEAEVLVGILLVAHPACLGPEPVCKGGFACSAQPDLLGKLWALLHSASSMLCWGGGRDA